MSSNSVADNHLTSSNTEEVESPRRRVLMENPRRKGWSLTDRRADQEVLQEMGVGLLDPDDNDAPCDTSASTSTGSSSLNKSLKRKHDLENLNPNANSVTSPLSKYSSPKRAYMESPGPSRVRSPKSNEKAQSQQEQSTELLKAKAFVDEETPLAQSVSAQEFGECRRALRARADSYSSPPPPPAAACPAPACSPLGCDSFCSLSDEMLLSVFRWLPKRTLAKCMLVCKRWHRVASDETLWQRLDLGYKMLNKGALGKILAKKPVIVRLASSDIGEWHPAAPALASRVQYLDLSVCSVDRRTLDALLARCPALRKLSLESVQVYDSTCRLIGKCSNLEALNMTMARGLTADGLRSILEGCSNIQSLNVSWCALALDALQTLVSVLPPRLQRLNISGAKLMDDDCVKRLVCRCPRLLELDLSDCAALTEAALEAVLQLRRLEHLALSRCYYIPPQSLTRLGSMPALQYLEVWGTLRTGSLGVLRAALCAVQLNQFMFSAVARPTVGPRRTSIWGLRTRDWI